MMKNAFLREVHVLRLDLNWIVHLVYLDYSIYNYVFSFSDTSEMRSSKHLLLSYGNFVFC